MDPSSSWAVLGSPCSSDHETLSLASVRSDDIGMSLELQHMHADASVTALQTQICHQTARCFPHI